jgi:adenosine deaminase
MTPPADALERWLSAMPKAELHLHLDGSLRPETALELAHRRGNGTADPTLGLPADPSLGLPAELPDDVAGMRARLVAPPRCADQADLLRAFDLPVALLQDAEALERCAGELVEDVAREGTCYAEIRWAPSLHTRAGLGLREGIAAVARGVTGAADAHGIHVRLIAVALRTHLPETALEVARAAVEALPDGLTGFDLAGLEHLAPDPRRFGAAFEVARAGGLGITCHAGEWGGAAQVRSALAVDPWRIAHGAPAADDAALMVDLRARGVTLDLCPTSNLQAGIGRDDGGAPLPRLLHARVPVTISTDDRTVSDLTLVRELQRAVERLGLTPADVVTVMRQAYAAAFLHHDEALRARLQTGFEKWLAGYPLPA